MKLRDLPTPALVLDRLVLERNTAAMTRRVRDHGVKLRPHMKTAKSIDVARHALAGNFGGIAVSTVNEARYFADHGIKDMVYTVPMTPDKLVAIAALVRQGVRFVMLTDSVAGARKIAARGARLDTVFDLRIEIDSGDHRSGIAPDAPELVEIGQVVAGSPHCRLDGVLTHAGHSYHCSSVDEVRQVAAGERSAVLTAARRLRESGLPCPTVSVGSTPTARHGTSFDGITEVCCGVYMFGDLFQAEIGSCARGDIAVSVLASIIAQRRQDNRLLLDAGALALSKDRSTNATRHDFGYGMVVDEAGAACLGGMVVRDVYQEHGVVTSDAPIDFAALPIGGRLRVLPNHSCITAAAHDRYHVVAGGDDVETVWHRSNGWF